MCFTASELTRHPNSSADRAQPKESTPAFKSHAMLRTGTHASHCLLFDFSPKPCLLSRSRCPPPPPTRKKAHTATWLHAACCPCLLLASPGGAPRSELLTPSDDAREALEEKPGDQGGCRKGSQEQPLVPVKDLTKACFTEGIQ